MTLLNSIDWGTSVTPVGGVINVYFAAGGETYDGITSNGWSAYEIGQAMAAFAVYEDILNVTFNQVFVPAQSQFQLVTTTSSNIGGTLGYFIPPGYANSGVGVFATDGAGWNDTGGLAQGGFGFVTLLHEFGHGLGLAHSHDTGGTSSIMAGVSASFGDYGDYDLNQGIFTVMSYNDGWQTAPHGTPLSNNYGWSGSIMALDIAVLQDKYGANTTNNNGNNVYILPSSNASGTFYSAIWDSGGIDTIFNSSATGSTIDLQAASLLYNYGGGGFVSYTTGIHGGFTIANGVVIENATGGSGDDILIGNSANNGLNGGAGNDTVSYANDLSMDLVINLVTQTASSSFSGSDTLISIENAIGGAGNDLIYGNSAVNTLKGGGGNDVIIAGSGNDLIHGEGGDDWLYGQGGDDFIFAGAGAVDVSSGGDGNDTIYGETGFDYIYGDAGNDTIYGGFGIDVAYGGDGADYLYGNSETDWLFGGDGDDRLYGGSNPDLLFGEAGSDYINSGSGNDWLWGGSSNGLGDGVTDYFQFADGWGVDVIYDFENGIDKIDFSFSSVSSFSQLSVGQIAGGFTWISDGISVIYLWGAGNVNVGANNIDASDFIF